MTILESAVVATFIVLFVTAVIAASVRIVKVAIALGRRRRAWNADLRFSPPEDPVILNAQLTAERRLYEHELRVAREAERRERTHRPARTAL